MSRVWVLLTVGLGEDLVGGLGPAEWFAALVVAVDERADSADQIRDAGEGAATDGLAGNDAEENLDHVHPGRAGRGEVHGDPRVLRTNSDTRHWKLSSIL